MNRIEFTDMPQMMRAEHVAQALNISRSKAYELMHQRGFPSVKIGKLLFANKALLECWVTQQTTQK